MNDKSGAFLRTGLINEQHYYCVAFVRLSFGLPLKSWRGFGFPQARQLVTLVFAAFRRS